MPDSTAPPTDSPRVRLATVLREETIAALSDALKAEGVTLSDDARDRIVTAIVAGVDKMPDRTVNTLAAGDEETLRGACRGVIRHKLPGLIAEVRPRGPVDAALSLVLARFGGRR